MTYGGRWTRRDDRPVSRILRIIRALAEGSFVALGFVVAILAVGIPVALAARAVRAVVLWLAGNGIVAFGRTIEIAASVAGVLGGAATVATSLVLFFAWRRRLMSAHLTRRPRSWADQPIEPARLRPGPHTAPRSLGTVDAVSPS
jgi:hypothetical protein